MALASTFVDITDREKSILVHCESYDRLLFAQWIDTPRYHFFPT